MYIFLITIAPLPANATNAIYEKFVNYIIRFCKGIGQSDWVFIIDCFICKKICVWLKIGEADHMIKLNLKIFDGSIEVCDSFG